MFRISLDEIKSDELRYLMTNQVAGALVVFEGLVRDTNQGLRVKSLEYQAYEEMADVEGNKIVQEAKDKFNILDALCIHRFGHLKLKDCAVWIGVTAKHRDDAYKASRFIIDQIKLRLPIWKKEHYVDEEAKWVYCKDHHTHVHLCSNDYYSVSRKIYPINKISGKKVAVIGVGGLGCAVSFDLATIGLKDLTIVDGDIVSTSNLHRQFLYDAADIGEKKVIVAKNTIEQKCPFIKIYTIDNHILEANLDNLKGYDVIVDCTDNLKTKFLLHNFCIAQDIALVSAAINKNQAYIRTFFNAGCLQCQHVDTFEDKSSWLDCDSAGVISSWVNTIAHMQAAEVIEFLFNGSNKSLKHSLFIDLANYEIQKILNLKNENCLLCVQKIMEVLDTGMKSVSNEATLKFDIVNLTDAEVFDRALELKGTVQLICKNDIRSKRLAKILNENKSTNVTFV